MRARARSFATSRSGFCRNWPRSPEIGKNGKLRLIDIEPGGQPPLDMIGTGKTPAEKPRRHQYGSDAHHQHEGMAELEEVRAREDKGLDDDSKAASDHNRGAERRDEHHERVSLARARLGARFGVHADHF